MKWNKLINAQQCNGATIGLWHMADHHLMEIGFNLSIFGTCTGKLFSMNLNKLINAQQDQGNTKKSRKEQIKE